MKLPCRIFLDQLSAFMDGELSAEASSEVQRHIDQCELCAREIASFKLLGDLARHDSDSRIGVPLWESLEMRMNRMPVDAQEQANEVSGTCDQTVRRLAPARSPNDKTIIGTIAALAASLLIIVNFSPWMSGDRSPTSSSPVTQASMAAMNLQPLVELFEQGTNLALNQLANQFPTVDISIEEADSYFRKPTFIKLAADKHGLPGGAKVAAAKRINFPSYNRREGECDCASGGCNCVACVCQRPDGSTYLVLEYCKSQEVSFGSLPVQLVRRDGREFRQVIVNGTQALSFERPTGRVTVVGIHGDSEIETLLASN